MRSIFDSSRSMASETRATIDPAPVSPGGGLVAMSAALGRDARCLRATFSVAFSIASTAV